MHCSNSHISFFSKCQICGDAEAIWFERLYKVTDMFTEWNLNKYGSHIICNWNFMLLSCSNLRNIGPFPYRFDQNRRLSVYKRL